MCDAYNNYYNIIAYTFAMYAAKGRVPFDQNFQKFRFKIVIAFDKGERLHSAVAFENFGALIDTDLAPPKNSSGAKLFRENDVIFIGHVLNLVLRLSLLCLLNEVAMCFVSTKSPVSRLPRVLVCFLVQFDLLFAFDVLSCRMSGLCFLVYFICSRSQSPRLRDVNLGNSCI